MTCIARRDPSQFGYESLSSPSGRNQQKLVKQSRLGEVIDIAISRCLSGFLSYLPFKIAVIVNRPSHNHPIVLCYTHSVRRIPSQAWLLAILSGILQVLIFPSPSLFFLG